MHRICLLLACLLLAACDQDQSISPFTTDGCSLFPDGWPDEPEAWYDCCFVHDVAYWQGGTAHQRLKADEHLRQCVLNNTGSESLAWTMYQGVRAGGHPAFPNWYRWGYGWSYGRGYEALSDDEQAAIDTALENFSARQSE